MYPRPHFTPITLSRRLFSSALLKTLVAQNSNVNHVAQADTHSSTLLGGVSVLVWQCNRPLVSLRSPPELLKADSRNMYWYELYCFPHGAYIRRPVPILV
jgi:hypothetical protein